MLDTTMFHGSGGGRGQNINLVATINNHDTQLNKIKVIIQENGIGYRQVVAVVNVEAALKFVNAVAMSLRQYVPFNINVTLKIIDNINSAETFNVVEYKPEKLKLPLNKPAVTIPIGMDTKIGTLVISKTMNGKFTARMLGDINLNSLWETDTIEELYHLVDQVKDVLKQVIDLGLVIFTVKDDTGA